MIRQTAIAGLLLGLLIFTAAPSFSQSAETTPQSAVTAPQPAETPPQPVGIRGTIEAIDSEQRTIQVMPIPRRGAQVQTVLVPADARIYRKTDVTEAGLAVGHILELQSPALEASELIAAWATVSFPPRRLSVIADVIALQPLTLRVGPTITITIRNLAGVEFYRWQKVELADISTGERLGAVAQQADGKLTANLIRLWPAAPPPPMRPTIQPTIQPPVSKSPAKSTSKP